MARPAADAPAASSRATAGAVASADSWLARQAGCPNEDTRPATANMSLTATVTPSSGPDPVPGSRTESGTQQCTDSALSGTPTPMID